jgi:hypothetical protein
VIPLAAIVDALKADSMLTADSEDRVYDHDVRRGKHPEIFDDFGFILPTISVDDRGGGGRAPFAPSGSFEDLVYIWGFGASAEVVKRMMARVLAILHGWQDSETRSMLVYGGRLGNTDGAIADSEMDYVRFRVAGVFGGVDA